MTDLQIDAREPFASAPEEFDAPHQHECPECGNKWKCAERSFLPFDSDEDCRWYDRVVCGDCLRRRQQVHG